LGGGTLSTQAGAADSLGMSSGGGQGSGGLNSFNSPMNVLSNFEAHRSMQEGHQPGPPLQIPGFYDGLSPRQKEDQQEQNIQQK